MLLMLRPGGWRGIMLIIKDLGAMTVWDVHSVSHSGVTLDKLLELMVPQ